MNLVGRRRVFELVASEVEHKQPEIELGSGARPGFDKLGQRRGPWVVPGPVQPISERMFSLGNKGLPRSPESNDVVVNFLLARDLDQANIALPPVADRLRPQARAPFVVRLEILIRRIIALALHEAKGAGIGIAKRADL